MMLYILASKRAHERKERIKKTCSYLVNRSFHLPDLTLDDYSPFSAAVRAVVADYGNTSLALMDDDDRYSHNLQS